MRMALTKVLAFMILAAAWTPLTAHPNLAEGFTRLPEGSVVAVMPLDVELYSQTAGGVLEPQAEWTSQGAGNLKAAALARPLPGQGRFQELPGDEDEQTAELVHLHQAVAHAISLHHLGAMKLPSKHGKLDWTLGEEAAHVRDQIPADYALFLFLRDSYATAGRKAAIAVFALLGGYMPGGAQVGYASLVDLRTGRVVWFNRMANATGDVRDPVAAHKTLDRLLAGFPG
jgi:hypothetical protein